MGLETGTGNGSDTAPEESTRTSRIMSVTSHFQPEIKMHPDVPFKRIIRQGLFPALLLTVFLQAGCAARKPPAPPPQLVAPALLTPEDAVHLLIHKYGAPTSMRASGKIATTFPGEEHRRQASMALMLRKPDRVRIRAYRPLAPALFEFISGDDECWLYIPSRRTAYLSEGCRPFRVEDSYVAASGEAIVAALLVLVDADALQSAWVSSVPEDGLTKLVLAEAGGTTKEIWIDSASGLATRQVLRETDGSVQADIRYMGHAYDEGMAVPIETDVLLPQTGMIVSIQIRQFEIDPEIPSDAFDFSPPDGADIFRAIDTFPPRAQPKN